MGECGAVGNAAAGVSADDGVSVAGGAYGARDGGGGDGGDGEYAGGVCDFRAGLHGGAGVSGGEVGIGAIPGGGADVDDRGDGAGSEGDPGWDVALFGTEFCEGERDSVFIAWECAGICMDDELGGEYAAGGD